MSETNSEKSKLNFAAIISGFKNFVFPSEEMERIANARADVCSRCPDMNPEHKFRKLLPDDKIEIINGAGCNRCGCLLSAKVRQMIQSCPEGKWEE